MSSNHKWTIAVLAFILAALLIPATTSAGGGNIVSNDEIVSCTTFFGFYGDRQEVSHYSGSKPWFWELQWEPAELIPGLNPGPIWKFRSHHTDLLGGPAGYTLLVDGRPISGQIWTDRATLIPNNPIVSRRIADTIPATRDEALALVGLDTTNYAYLKWSHGPEWGVFLRNYAPTTFTVPPGFTGEIYGVRHQPGKAAGSYMNLRPAGPLCNAP